MTIDRKAVTPEGFLVVDAKIARTGIYQYAGYEMGRPDIPVIRVLRGEDTVFDEESMASFAYKPVTLDHPTQDVDASNVQGLFKGIVGDTIKRDGEYVRVPMTIMAADAIAAIDNGKRQLSPGYLVDVDDTPGVDPTYGAYDMRMTGKIQANHVAIVDMARGGSACRIGDSFATLQDKQEGQPEMTGTKTITFDGLPLLVTDAAEMALAKRDATIVDLNGTIAARDATIAELQTQVATLTTDNATLKQAAADAKPTPQALAAMVAARSSVVADAKAFAPDLAVTDSMSDADIRKAVVLARVGDAAKDWTDAQFEASFATLPRDAAADANAAIGRAFSTPANDTIAAAQKAADDARAARLDKLANAHKGPKAA